MAPANPVVRRDLTAEQLVEGDVEARGQGHHRLEGEPSLPSLHLRDGAGGDAGEAGEIARAQVPAQPVATQRPADARRRVAGLKPRRAGLGGGADWLSS